jgi:hypothetical protein
MRFAWHMSYDYMVELACTCGIGFVEVTCYVDHALNNHDMGNLLPQSCIYHLTCLWILVILFIWFVERAGAHLGNLALGSCNNRRSPILVYKIFKARYVLASLLNISFMYFAKKWFSNGFVSLTGVTCWIFSPLFSLK